MNINLTKLLICLLNILIINLVWKFHDKSSNGKKKKVAAKTDTDPDRQTDRHKKVGIILAIEEVCSSFATNRP